MANIRPKDLPEKSNIASNSAIIIDDGDGVWQSTPADIIAGAGTAGAASLKTSTGVSVESALDPGLRSDLAADDGGAGIVSWVGTDTGVQARTVQVALRDQTLNPKDFGAIGDGGYHSLASIGYTLSTAQARWGSDIVTSVDQSVDSVAINAALRAASSGPRTVQLPDGRYCLSESLRVPSFVTFQGQSREGSVLYNQTFVLDQPMMVNSDSTAFLFAVIRNMTILGGTMVLQVSASIETAGCTFENLTANLQSAKSMEWSSCQTTIFRNCEFRGARDVGIDFLGFPCNAVTLDHVRIGDVRRFPLRLRGYDLFTICNSSSIEAGAVQPNNVTCSATASVMSVSAITGPNIEVGQLVVGAGIAPGTRVTGNAVTDPGTYTGGGGGGTYGISNDLAGDPQTFGSRSAIISYAAIDAEAGLSGTANMLVIRDSYFEGVPKILLHNLTASGTPSGTMLDGNKITNAIDGAGVIFSGNATVTLGTNYWGTSTPGPESATIVGQNKGMVLDRTWTPTVTAVSGTLTTVTVNEASYRDITGGLRRFTVDVTITDAGTGAGGIYVTLPSTPAGNDTAEGQEASGFGLSSLITSGDNRLTIKKSSDGSFPGATGNRLSVSGVYRVQ